jgi:hypothetical protein
MPAHQTVDANQGWLPLAVRKAPGCKRKGKQPVERIGRFEGLGGVLTLFSEARSDIVKRVAIPLAARSGSVLAAEQCDAPMPIAAVLACETC